MATKERILWIAAVTFFAISYIAVSVAYEHAKRDLRYANHELQIKRMAKQ
jgi:hypothetical protein